MTPLNLSTASESQVNAMVAQHVAGWLFIPCKKREICGYVRSPDFKITVTLWRNGTSSAYLPDYIHDLNALLPLLNKHDWLLGNERGCWFCEINFPENRIIKFGSTLNLAIITALLRAAWVEVKE